MKDDLKFIFANVNDWLKYAEAKNAALTSIIGAFIFGIISSWNKIPLLMHPVLKYYVLPLFIICLIICVWSFVPKLNYKNILDKVIKNQKSKKTEDKNEGNNLEKLLENKNLIYYGDLRLFNQKILLKRLKIESPTNIEMDLAQQIIVNSNITWLKYILFKWAGNLFLFGIISGAIIITLIEILKIK